MAFSGSQITRLGLYGGPRGLYGSFVGKTEAVVVEGGQTPLGHAGGLLATQRLIGRSLN